MVDEQPTYIEELTMQQQNDNSALIIPFYDEIPSDAKYPCDTERLRYDKSDHRYYLTDAAILTIGRKRKSA